jgi:hypothetical protein
MLAQSPCSAFSQAAACGLEVELGVSWRISLAGSPRLSPKMQCVMVRENQCRRPMSYQSPRISSELGLELRETQTEREIGRERD